MSLRINLGCGDSPTLGWINLDNSPAIKLANQPIKTAILKRIGLLSKVQLDNIEFNKRNKIIFADATKRLPFNDKSVSVIYSAHMLEHLSQSDAEHVLIEAKRVLKPGGVIRISVPDLKIIIQEYLESGDARACMQRLMMQAPSLKTFKDKLMLLLIGYRHHQWMYDGASLSKLLEQCGFKEIEIMKKGKTKIVNPASLDLEERVLESVYVEGVA